MVGAIQSVGLTSGGNGTSLVIGSNANSQNIIWAMRSISAGPGIIISPDIPSIGNILITATGIPPLVSLVTASTHWAGSVTPNVLPVFIAAYPVIITAIVGRVEQASTTAATITLVKATDGQSIADGIALTIGTFDVTSTPFVVFGLELVTDNTILTLAPGDTIGIRTTGTWTNAYGGMNVHMAPFPK